MLDLNARTVFNCCRAVVPLLLAGGGGHIVNVAARAATRGIGHMGPYCASKAAVITLTESLADELKDRGSPSTASSPARSTPPRTVRPCPTRTTAAGYRSRRWPT